MVQICGKDPLRDEGILYEKLLRESGVQTKLHTYVAASLLALTCTRFMDGSDLYLHSMCTTVTRECHMDSIMVRLLLTPVSGSKLN